MKVLGIIYGSCIDSEKLKSVFRARARETHPDLTRDPKTGLYFNLVIQAKEFLEGSSDSYFLEDDSLVADFLGESVVRLEKSYSGWVSSQGFYGFMGVN